MYSSEQIYIINKIEHLLDDANLNSYKANTDFFPRESIDSLYRMCDFLEDKIGVYGADWITGIFFKNNYLQVRTIHITSNNIMEITYHLHKSAGKWIERTTTNQVF